MCTGNQYLMKTFTLHTLKNPWWIMSICLREYGALHFKHELYRVRQHKIYASYTKFYLTLTTSKWNLYSQRAHQFSECTFIGIGKSWYKESHWRVRVGAEVCESFVVHHLMGTGLCCAPLTCVVHQRAVVHKGDLCPWEVGVIPNTLPTTPWFLS